MPRSGLEVFMGGPKLLKIENQEYLNMRTLVLNSDFTPLRLVPLSTTSWQEAICLVYLNKARILEHYDREVHSPTQSFKMPSVIVLNTYKKLDHRPRYSKYNVKLRDKFTCQYCDTRRSSKSLTVDHVLPKAKGGKTNWENIVAACKPCNHGKKDNHHIKPKNPPRKPEYYDLAVSFLREKQIKHEHWDKWLPTV